MIHFCNVHLFCYGIDVPIGNWSQEDFAIQCTSSWRNMQIDASLSSACADIVETFAVNLRSCSKLGLYFR